MNEHGCEQESLIYSVALGASTPEQAAEVEAHVASCAACGRLMESLRPIAASLADWPADVLRPSDSLWDRLSRRIAPDAAETAQRRPPHDGRSPTGKKPRPESPARSSQATRPGIA